MNDGAVLRRSEWTKDRHEWRSANRKRGNHLELTKWVQEHTEQTVVELDARVQDTLREVHSAIAAYQLESERVTIRSVTAPPSSETEAAAKVVTSSIRTLRLYTGAALMGAIVGGLAFSWLGHREIAQMTGAVCAVLGYFIIRSGNTNGKRAS